MAFQTRTGKYAQLLERCKSLEPIPTAVAHPCEASALAGAIEAGDHKLIRPILVGPRSKIESIAKECNVDLRKIEIVDTPHSVASAQAAVGLIREGKAELLMK